jgi:hypothetical protein
VNAPLPSLEAFRAEWLGQGYDEVLAREWAPGQALVVRGSLVLGCAGEQRTLQAGDRFGLAADVPHTEHYGPEGATFWVARRNPR